MQTPHLSELLSVMRRLRDPDTGCPWDVKQSMPSLVRYTLEEAYEVADAIERGDPVEICNELGDLLFQIVFYAQIATEQGLFDFDDVARAISTKLIRRHPHVFDASNERRLTDEQLSAQWESIKQKEKASLEEHALDSVFERLKQGVPAFNRAYDLQNACAGVGFDWHCAEDVFDKVNEELAELKDEVGVNDNQTRIEEEFGDLLFAMVNLARHLDIEPETALRKANNKFERRFRWIESALRAQGQSPQTLPIESLESYWQQAKQAEEPKQ